MGPGSTMALQNLQRDPQEAQAHVLLHSVLVQRLQRHEQHVLSSAPVFRLSAAVLLWTAAALASACHLHQSVRVCP